ncbi:MAG: preprotein translocase subunit YajC [Clostridia bacterium]|nr:preprotein translocase subunit YajC [Clostridia bacterium]
MAALIQFGPLVLILVVMYFLMIRPQQKKQKEEQKMRNSLRVGDELTTIGGIKGRVVAIKEDTITIETGADRSKLQFEKWAIQTVHTKHDDPIDNDDDDDDDDI